MDNPGKIVSDNRQNEGMLYGRQVNKETGAVLCTAPAKMKIEKDIFD
jgi:hypothetical protein